MRWFFHDLFTGARFDVLNGIELRRRTMTAALLAAAGLSIAPLLPARAGGRRPSLVGSRRWIAFYGTTVSLKAWKTLELAVLDPDAFEVPAPGGPLRLAYISAGEADEKRWYWPQAKGRPYLVESNPDWPEAHRVDIRADAWRKLLLEEVVPKALAKGYDGVFLDTLDTAQYLQSKDTAAYAGSMDAARGLVESLRSRYPGKLILLNNALPLLDGLADAADGVAVEDLYTRCDPRAESCVPTPEEVSGAKEGTLSRWKEKTGKPVFVLLYSSLRERDSPAVRKAVRRCLKKGFLPYLALPSLMSLGRVAPGSR